MSGRVVAGDVLGNVAEPARTEAPRQAPRPFTGQLSHYAETALENECAELASCPRGTDGGRHRRTFKVSAQLGELVAGGALPRELVVSHVLDAAAACGAVADYGERKVMEQIEAGLSAGEANPRSGDAPRTATPKPAADAPEEPAWIREELDGEAEPEAAPTVEASEPETKPEPEADETPALPESLWRPGFAEFRAAWGHTTESPDAFLWSAYLVATAAVLGRNPSLALGVDVHANVYVANLGRSGGARKSTGQAKADRILANVDQGVTVLHGIGSPEGLIEFLGGELGRSHRVVVNVNELSTVLRKGAQEATRGLAPLLCTLYDCPPSVSLPNRKKPLEAREPYLCMIGSTTPDWLRADLTVDDVRGGLAGRFCYFVGRPKAPIPLPPPPDARALTEAESILYAARERSVLAREYSIDGDAAELFKAWYYAERARQYPTPILDTLAQRLHVFAWKASLVFAVLEGTETVTAAQMAAALAFADYQRGTQAAVFHGFGTSEAARCAERILAALVKHGPLAGWELAHKVRHVEPQTLARAIGTLAQSRRIEERQEGRKRVFVALGRHDGTRSGTVSGTGSKRKRD